jgi:hypothetical protein
MSGDTQEGGAGQFPRPDRGDHSAVSAERIPVDDDVTVILLTLAARQREGPFAPLLRRLERPDGANWFLDAVSACCREARVGAALLTDPRSGPAALRRLKSWAKTILAGAARPESDAAAAGSPIADETRTLALLAYALAVGVGLAVHNVRLSTRPPQEWDPLFVDLAELAPMPWSDAFRAAAGK